MNSGLKPQQMHPFTVCACEGVHWSVSCFTHNLMWRARQLVHAGNDSKHHRVFRLDSESPRGHKILLVRCCKF